MKNSNFHPLSFARSPAVILFETENENMWSNWQDYIIATRTKKGVFTVVARKLGDEYLDGKTKQKWFLIHSVSNVRTPKGFMAAVQECERELNVDVYWDDVIASISRLDDEFSIAVQRLIDDY